jgi:hypothetical protein
MIRATALALLVLVFGGLRLPIESALTEANHRAHFQQANLDLDLREQIGQMAFVAALSGFRSLVADLIYIQANGAWERTEWGRLLLLFRQVTALQPRALLYWEMGAWHMAWNASAAALRDRSMPNDDMRRRAQREYFDLGRDFLERGIRNNPERPQLYESMARLYREKYKNHAAAARYFARAASLPGAPEYDKRFAAYELSHVPGREREAYRALRGLYDAGEEERLPTLLRRLRFLEEKLGIPLQERIPDTQM